MDNQKRYEFFTSFDSDVQAFQALHRVIDYPKLQVDWGFDVYFKSFIAANCNYCVCIINNLLVSLACRLNYFQPTKEISNEQEV